tara:strand:- start:19425 stop:20189 length:765 start_codon:yes stop_codon:yes gene_type:complete
MDFSIWQAADQSWQLGACVRKTKSGGHGRLLYRWQSESLANSDWEPSGILLQADSAFGEAVGGLQTPYVFKHGQRYFMVYGAWSSICLATGSDGKTFARSLNTAHESRLFPDCPDALLRDPMITTLGGRHYLYYTRVLDGRGAICARFSTDLVNWSESYVVSRGGSGGTGPADAECAFVYHQGDDLLLFRWDERGITNIYRSNDPLNFGIDHDGFKVGELPYEVVRIVRNGQDFYITSLHDDLTGIRLARMSWA